MTTQHDFSTAVLPRWTLGDRLRKVRTTAGLDQRTFALRLEVPAGSLAAWETDRVRPRDVVALARRVELLTRVPAAWLLGVHEDGPTDGGTSVERPRPDSNWRPSDYEVATPAASLMAARVQRERRANPLSRPAAEPLRRAA